MERREEDQIHTHSLLGERREEGFEGEERGKEGGR